MPRKKPTEPLNTERAAARVGLSSSTLEKMRCYRSMKGPPFVKIGSRVIYRESDLDDWLASRVRRAPPRPLPKRRPRRG